MLTILLLVFVALLLIGVPIGLAMLGSAMLVIGIEGIPLSVVAQRVATGVQSFPLLAIPLFTLAGALMNESGISERLFGFTRAFVGHIRGGLAQTAIVGNVFLSGITGSSVADCAATSRLFVPQLVKAAGCAVWSPNGGALGQALVQEAQALGLQVIPWTLNAPDDMVRVIGWKVDGLITDYPDRAREVMRSQGLPLPAAVTVK